MRRKCDQHWSYKWQVSAGAGDRCPGITELVPPTALLEHFSSIFPTSFRRPVRRGEIWPATSEHSFATPAARHGNTLSGLCTCLRRSSLGLVWFFATHKSICPPTPEPAFRVRFAMFPTCQKMAPIAHGVRTKFRTAFARDSRLRGVPRRSPPAPRSTSSRIRRNRHPPAFYNVHGPKMHLSFYPRCDVCTHATQRMAVSAGAASPGFIVSCGSTVSCNFAKVWLVVQLPSRAHSCAALVHHIGYAARARQSKNVSSCFCLFTPRHMFVDAHQPSAC